MHLMNRIRAIFTGSRHKERIPPGHQPLDEEEEEVEELVALDII